MDGNAAAGGGMLLVGLVLFALPIIGLVVLMVKGFNKVERLDRNRAIERDLRNSVADLDVQQRAARKILREYEGG
jgi:hypothetical protein